MPLSHHNLISLADTAISAACQAGEIIQQHSQHQLNIQTKIAGDSIASQVLTEVDLLCQTSILKILQPSCQEFNLAILSEELEDDKARLEKDYFWSIDPLDGTLPFIENNSGYAVSIALVSRAGTALIGVIYDPIEKVLYHAIDGAGAFRNHQAWQLQQNQFLTFVSDRSLLQQKNYPQLKPQIENMALELGYTGIKTIQHGGAAMNACWVLENAPACYFKFPKSQNGGGSLWDYAASSCIFNQINAYVSDIYGHPLQLNRADSCFMNHRGILYASDDYIAQKIQTIFSRLFD